MRNGWEKSVWELTIMSLLLTADVAKLDLRIGRGLMSIVSADEDDVCGPEGRLR